jgi:hypothetical protein
MHIPVWLACFIQSIGVINLWRRTSAWLPLQEAFPGACIQLETHTTSVLVAQEAAEVYVTSWVGGDVVSTTVALSPCVTRGDIWNMLFIDIISVGNVALAHPGLYLGLVYRVTTDFSQACLGKSCWTSLVWWRRLHISVGLWQCVIFRSEVGSHCARVINDKQ